MTSTTQIDIKWGYRLDKKGGSTPWSTLLVFPEVEETDYKIGDHNIFFYEREITEYYGLIV